MKYSNGMCLRPDSSGHYLFDGITKADFMQFKRSVFKTHHCKLIKLGSFCSMQKSDHFSL